MGTVKNKGIHASVVKTSRVLALNSFYVLLGHNLSSGLRDEAENLGRSEDLRSLLALPQEGPAD